MDLMRLGSTIPKIPSDSAFTQFKANLITNGTYTTELNALESCYQAIPYAFRDSDVFMLAGAYKVGQIAGYDNTGSVVDFGFSRNNIKNGFNGNYAPLEVSANIPLLDQVYYSNGVLGYVIENAKTTTLDSTPSIRFASGCTAIINGFMINAVGTNSTAISLKQGYLNYGLIQGNSYSIIVDTNTVNNREIIFSTYNASAEFFIIHTGTRALTIPSLSNSRMSNKKMEWLNSRFVRISFLWIGTNVSNDNMGLTIYTPNSELLGIGYVTDSATRTPIKSTATVLGSSEADVIAPITLTNSAKVCILTSKGINVINAPLGTFDINPYLTNSKLRLFTIKYN